VHRAGPSTTMGVRRKPLLLNKGVSTFLLRGRQGTAHAANRLQEVAQGPRRSTWRVKAKEITRRHQQAPPLSQVGVRALEPVEEDVTVRPLVGLQQASNFTDLQGRRKVLNIRSSRPVGIWLSTRNQERARMLLRRAMRRPSRVDGSPRSIQS